MVTRAMKAIEELIGLLPKRKRGEVGSALSLRLKIITLGEVGDWSTILKEIKDFATQNKLQPVAPNLYWARLLRDLSTTE